MNKIGYYPGCSLTGSAKEFDKSVKKICSLIDVELVEIEDWNCCGATSAHATNHFLSIALPMLNLVKAKGQGIDKILAPCAACYNRLATSQYEVEKNESIKEKISGLLESNLDFKIDVVNIIQFLRDIACERIANLKKVSFKGLKAACYYGCLLLRPNSISHFDDCEDPGSMEEILKLIDIETINWNFKT